MSEPALQILLTPEQQRFMERRLKKALTKHLFAHNVSDETVADIAAYATGYKNHEQRDAATPHEAPPQWSIPFLKAGDGQLPPEKLEQLLQQGWFLANCDGEYLDLEIEHDYAEATERTPRCSFNFKVNFDFTRCQVDILFGDNKGSGFNEYARLQPQKDQPVTSWVNLLETLENATGEAEKDVYQHLRANSDLRDSLCSTFIELNKWLYRPF